MRFKCDQDAIIKVIIWSRSLISHLDCYAIELGFKWDRSMWDRNNKSGRNRLRDHIIKGLGSKENGLG